MKHVLLFSLIVLGCFALHECIVIPNANPCTEQPGVVGLCRASMTRFTYNPRTDRCELFVYGGCGGNGNNFVSGQLCRETCKPT